LSPYVLFLLHTQILLRNDLSSPSSLVSYREMAGFGSGPLNPIFATGTHSVLLLYVTTFKRVLAEQYKDIPEAEYLLCQL